MKLNLKLQIFFCLNAELYREVERVQVARRADHLLLTFRGCIVTVIPRLFIPTKTSSAVIYNLFVECGIMFRRRGTGAANL